MAFHRSGQIAAAIVSACGAFAATGFAARAETMDGTTCRSARPAAFQNGLALVPRSMTVVAIGSSSTEGIARNAKDKLYPATLQKSLTKMWPNARVEVVNRGRGGETMAQTIARFETDVVALKPSLVIWQLGVNDVLRFDGVTGRREEIQAGLKVLAERKIPVVLLDLQYAPRVIQDADAMPMQDLIDEAARSGTRGEVFHFKRFAAMKALAERSRVPMSDMTDIDELHMTDAMHSCIGELLAEMIASRPVVAGAAR